MTTLSSEADGSVRRIEYAYDGQGNAYLITSYDAASGGNIVNQVQREFNGLGQLTKEWQSHSGAVNTGTTPKVQYAHSEMTGGANHSRLTSITTESSFHSIPRNVVEPPQIQAFSRNESCTTHEGLVHFKH